MNPMHNFITVLLLHNYLAVAPASGKCVLGEGLLNALVEPSGVLQKGEYAAEENVLGWSSGPTDGIKSNLTESELKDCLQEYQKAVIVVGGKPLPPGVTPEKDPSQQPYLPSASGKDVLINNNGNGHGEYYTTYDGSKYKFKEKGYVIDPPTSDQSKTPPTPSTPKPSTLPSVSVTTTKQPGKGPGKKKEDELRQWYKAFISVMSKYI